MATITISIPASITTRVIDGVSGQYGYQTLINGEANPETKTQFATRMARTWVKESVKAYEATLAANNAKNSAIVAAEAEILLT